MLLFAVQDIRTLLATPEWQAKRKQLIYFSAAVMFLDQLEACQPRLLTLLSSRTASDVIDTIPFFLAAAQFNLDCAQVSLRQSLIHPQRRRQRACLLFRHERYDLCLLGSLSPSASILQPHTHIRSVRHNETKQNQSTIDR